MGSNRCRAVIGACRPKGRIRPQSDGHTTLMTTSLIPSTANAARSPGENRECRNDAAGDDDHARFQVTLALRQQVRQPGEPGIWVFGAAFADIADAGCSLQIGGHHR